MLVKVFFFSFCGDKAQPQSTTILTCRQTCRATRETAVASPRQRNLFPTCASDPSMNEGYDAKLLTHEQRLGYVSMHGVRA